MFYADRAGALTSCLPPHVHFSDKTTKQVEFVDGQTESMASLPITLDAIQDEGCESVTLGVTAVTGSGSAVVEGGIHDVSAEASVRIEENDFTSAVLDSVPPEGPVVAGGLLSPATARVGGRRTSIVPRSRLAVIATSAEHEQP